MAARVSPIRLRPACYGEIPLIHQRLTEVITTSPHYGEPFKAYEKQRLNRTFLTALMDIDPRHILVSEHDGQIAGFMISGPQFGTLWLYWSYLFPEMRRKALALTAMRAFLGTWDGDRFHKVSTYTKPDNRVARLLMQRAGFAHVVTLENHILGEDFELHECALNKAVPGYDLGISIGLTARIRQKARSAWRVLPAAMQQAAGTPKRLFAR